MSKLHLFIIVFFLRVQCIIWIDACLWYEWIQWTAVVIYWSKWKLRWRKSDNAKKKKWNREAKTNISGINFEISVRFPITFWCSCYVGWESGCDCGWSESSWFCPRQNIKSTKMREVTIERDGRGRERKWWNQINNIQFPLNYMDN